MWRGCVSRVLFRVDVRRRGMAISLRPPLPTGSSTLPVPITPDQCIESGVATSGGTAWACTRWGLPSDRCHQRPGVLLPHLFTLTGGGVSLEAWGLSPQPTHLLEPSSLITQATRLPRRFISVALSLLRPSPAEAVGVTHHRVLSCSDFPRDWASPTPRPSRPRHNSHDTVSPATPDRVLIPRHFRQTLVMTNVQA